MSIGVYWFRRDLRLQDNPLLIRAVSECSHLILLLVAEDHEWEGQQWGMERMSQRRKQFHLESIQNLKDQIGFLGSHLYVRKGDAAEVLKGIFHECAFDRLYFEKLPGNDEDVSERAIHQWAEQKNLSVEYAWQRTLVDWDLDKIQALPNIFTTFRKEVERRLEVRDELPIPILPETINLASEDWKLEWSPLELDTRASMDYKGGASTAQIRLQEYMLSPMLLGQYKELRNGLYGADFSSKLSPWLALGCISPVQIYHRVKRYEEMYQPNESSYWMVFELLWRDFFQFTLLKTGSNYFYKDGFGAGKCPPIVNDEEAWMSWCLGTTQEPFVNALMNELRITGSMSNRGRQNAASYLIHDLKQDWRRGAAYFESLLLDYDVASNWGNWAYIAGVGNDPRSGRKFNIEKQAGQYDPGQQFQNLWREPSLLGQKMTKTA